MLPAYLITFREVIEATLIVVTVLSLLVKLNQKKGIKTTLYATGAAALSSMILIAFGSLLGLQIQKLYTGRAEAMIEGGLMVVSAIFITWAVFFLHRTFGRKKIKLLKTVQETIEKNEQKSLFILVFLAVFREGFEIALFLLTIYLSSNPLRIFVGFTGGAITALLVSAALLTSLLKLPLYKTFRITSILLVMFAAGLLARGIHEFNELGMLPELGKVTLAFIPHSSTFMGSLIQTIFGMSRTMNMVQISSYLSYTLLMSWILFFRARKQPQA